MLVAKIHIRPADEHSEALAIQEVEGYCHARNSLTAIKARFERLRAPGVEILPKWRERAAQEAATERTGRPPTPKALVRCSEPVNPNARVTSKELRLSMGAKYEAALEKLRTQWLSVEVVETGLARDAHQELHALANREAYAARTCHYATWWLAEAASKKAKHSLKSFDEGRAGMLPEHLQIERDVARYQGTTWTLNRKQLDRVQPIQPKQCWIQRERHGSNLREWPKYRWFLVLVYDLDRQPIHAPGQHGTVALNTGWSTRNQDNPLRTAYWVDDQGGHGSLDMDAVAWDRAQFSHSIAELQGNESAGLARTMGLPSNAKVPTVVRRAKESGVPEYRVTAEHLIHLDEYHRPMLSRAIRRRDDEYRRQADDLCRRYQRIVIEDVDYAKLIQRTKKTAAASSETIAGGARQLKAPGTFIDILKGRAVLHGCEIVSVDPAYHSRRCTCGHDMGASRDRMRACVECGLPWDVDRLAATNALASGQAVIDQQDPLAAEE